MGLILWALLGITLISLATSVSSSKIPLSLVKKECRKVGAEELIDKEGCDLMLVRINRCSGSCLSFTFPNPITRSTSIHAKCCRMVEWEMLETEVPCGEETKTVKIPSATKCECFDCAVQ